MVYFRWDSWRNTVGNGHLRLKMNWSWGIKYIAREQRPTHHLLHTIITNSFIILPHVNVFYNIFIENYDISATTLFICKVSLWNCKKNLLLTIDTSCVKLFYLTIWWTQNYKVWVDQFVKRKKCYTTRVSTKKHKINTYFSSL